MGIEGTADGQFQRPHDLDFDPAEKYLYTLDRDGARVQVFDKNGTFIKKWGSYGYWRRPIYFTLWGRC